MTLEEFYGPAEYGWSEQAYETRRAVREFCEEKTVAEIDTDELLKLSELVHLPWEDCLDLDQPHPLIEGVGGGGVCQVIEHGNINTVARTGEHFSHATARYIPLACNAVPELVRRLKASAEEADRLREENAKLREGLDKVKRIWMESEDTYEADCADMANVAFGVLDSLRKE